jgi:DNA-binding GntR family transcriptional regulator
VERSQQENRPTDGEIPSTDTKVDGDPVETGLDGDDATQRGQRSVEDLYETIRRRILDARMAAGSVISQVQLAEELEVNRTPLREALRMLQREGLVTGEYNRRARVAHLTSEDLEELYALRIVQEACAIRLTVPRMSDDELDRLDWLLAQMRRHPLPEEGVMAEPFHREFHRLLVGHAGARIVASVADLSDHSERYRRVFVRLAPTPTFEIGDREHTQIVAACRARDAAVASSLLARHFSRTAVTLSSIIDPEHDPVAVREALRLITGEASPPVPFAA